MMHQIDVGNGGIDHTTSELSAILSHACLPFHILVLHSPLVNVCSASHGCIALISGEGHNLCRISG